MYSTFKHHIGRQTYPTSDFNAIFRATSRKHICNLHLMFFHHFSIIISQHIQTLLCCSVSRTHGQSTLVSTRKEAILADATSSPKGSFSDQEESGWWVVFRFNPPSEVINWGTPPGWLVRYYIRD